MMRRSGAQMAGSIPNGPTGTASSAPARVASWRKERLPHRVARERLLEEDASQIRMAIEHDAEHVVGLAFAPIRSLPDRRERRYVWLERVAWRAEHDEDARVDAANKGHATELGTRVDTRIDRIAIAARRRIVAHHCRDLEQARCVDVDDDHVVQRRDARQVAEARRENVAHSGEVDGRPRRAQYQLSAFFFQA